MKPLDLSKFRKDVTKNLSGISMGFHDPTTWISTGNYALNYAISKDFYKGIPLGKVTMIAGESGCLPSSANVQIRYKDEQYIDTTVTVEQLKTLFKTKEEVSIYSPDGYVTVTKWFDKGRLDMVNIKTEDNLETRCAVNHLLQKYTGEWIPAANVTVGMELFTINGKSIVSEIENREEEDCFDFTVNHSNHRYYGDGFSSHNSGKSYISSGNVVKHAQEQGIFVVLIDSENALDESWLHALGVSTDEDKLMKINAAMIDDVAKIISDFVTNYKADYGKSKPEDRPKVLFVIDSIGMLLTPTDIDQFEKGELKGDFGRKPKALNALIRNCVNMFGDLNIGLIATNHSYENQSMFSNEIIISGGAGMVYASSIVIAIKKLQLKEDEDGTATSKVNGIRAKMKVMKTRYNKPFETVEVKIPYETGMNPYSGIVDLLIDKGLLEKSGNRLSYTNLDGEEIIKFKKHIEANKDGLLDMMMKEFTTHMERKELADIKAKEEELNTDDED